MRLHQVSQMVVKGVILDFGWTLSAGGINWDEYHASIRSTLKGLGYPVRLTRLKKAIQGALKELEKVRTRGEEMTFEDVYGSALTKLGIPRDEETLEMLHDLFKRHYKQELFPCVEEVLEELASRYSLALISNTMSDQPRLILERTGQARHFEVIVCSRDLGIRKPNPRIFKHVLDELGFRPDEAVHVGDSVEADMVGASNAGLVPVWIKNTMSPPWSGYAISSICEFPEFLENLRKQE